MSAASSSTEPLLSCCWKTLRHILPPFPTLLQAGPGSDPRRGRSWSSVTGRERGGVGGAAQVKQRSLWVKKPLEVIRNAPALPRVCKQGFRQALGDPFSL